MKNWLNLTKARKIDLFNNLSSLTGLPPQAIEKDAWVTLVLRMLFHSSVGDVLIFKGGTSLSKAYNLIERFSEDIDIAIDRGHLGFEGSLTKGQIRKLRKKSHEFVSTEMQEILLSQFDAYNINRSHFSINVENTKVSDQDPETIQINYNSVFEELPYLSQRVLIEIGARSLLEPNEKKLIKSIIDEHYEDTDFSEKEFYVKTVIPEKTFLEKLILLHEEFCKPVEKIRHQRMSRHLYDIGQIINSEYAQKSIKDSKLFKEIIDHRKVFTPIKMVNYDGLIPSNLKVFPPVKFIELYNSDYKEMQENMIYGDSLGFENLLKLISKFLKEIVEKNT